MSEIHTDPLLVKAMRVVDAWHQYTTTNGSYEYDRLGAAVDVLELQAFGALEMLVRKQSDDDD
jgi:hypothetical protein